MHSVYILHSNSLDRYYTGYSADLDKRMYFHAHPEARKFTAKAKDWELFVTIHCQTKTQALAIERHIKRMKSKVYIENLKKYPEIIQELLERHH